MQLRIVKINFKRCCDATKQRKLIKNAKQNEVK